MAAAGAAAPSRVPGLGLGTRLHLWPFQCRMRVWSVGPALAVNPTAHTSSADTTRTALSKLPAAGLGLGACVQLVPFQCKIRVLLPVLVLLLPTAQMLLAAGVIS